jgi:hypothetical protein
VRYSARRRTLAPRKIPAPREIGRQELHRIHRPLASRPPVALRALHVETTRLRPKLVAPICRQRRAIAGDATGREDCRAERHDAAAGRAAAHTALAQLVVIAGAGADLHWCSASLMAGSRSPSSTSSPSRCEAAARPSDCRHRTEQRNSRGNRRCVAVPSHGQSISRMSAL